MNRLADSHSPYLLGHAGNPVDWWPWTDEAFAEAARRDVPVFLSIGYATCHWCHVMEHESFEHPATAAALNAAFVCVKVDREERPDVDGIYMDACLAMNGSGGWPLTALLVPETREPFWVGTYLPRESRGGRLGVVDLAERVSRFWHEGREGVRQSAAQIAGIVRQIGQPEAEGDRLDGPDLGRAADALLARADTRDGGFGLAPKFPTPHLVTLALRLSERDRDATPARADALAEVAAHALDAMAAGGIHDHLAGGFHRYSTDRRWLLPHFEKTLYDQAGLAMAYTAAARALHPGYGAVARRTLNYVLARLTAPDGTFFCGEDADSLDAHGHKEEGAAYVWTPDEIDEVLGPDLGRLAAAYWSVRAGGNFLDEATREATGASILWHDPADADAREAAAREMVALGTTPEAVAARLLVARDRRPPPLTDDKRLTDWNGWMLSAFARAGTALGEPRYTEAAHRAARRLLEIMARDGGGLWHRAHTRPDGTDAVGVTGMLDDYAFLVGGLVDLYAATLETAWLGHALRLHAEAERRFARAGGGYFVTEAGTADLLVRRVDPDDGAMPSGYSQMVWNGLQLARLTGRADLEEAALAALRVPENARAHPTGHAHLYGALAYALAPGREIVIAGTPGAADTETLLATVRTHARPDDAILLVAPDDAEITALAPFTEAMATASARALAYVCQNHACALPTDAPGILAEQLAPGATAPSD